MPNKEIIKEWVAALRSGEYEQGEGALKQYREFNTGKGEHGDWDEPFEKPKFCCLGVLCDLAEQKGITKAKPEDRGANAVYEEMMGLPPESVEKWAGINRWEVTWPDEITPPTAAPCEPGCEVCEDFNGTRFKTIGLASLNDNHDWDFNQIADVIEKEWLVDA